MAIVSEIQLTPITADSLLLPEVRRSETLEGVCRSTISMYGEAGGVKPWTGYLARSNGEIVGTCAFKGEPRGGHVEIAYHTFPGHEGKGVATAMAGELLRLAEAAGVEKIIAHTRPERNASARVLEKLGFLCEGVVEDPEDGAVWEWKYSTPFTRRRAQRKMYGATLIGSSLLALGYVLLAIGGRDVPWPQWVVIGILMFNSVVHGLARDRFSPKMLVVLGWLAAVAGFVVLAAGVASLPFF